MTKDTATNRPLESRPWPAVGLSRNVLVLGCTSLANDIAGEMLFPLMPLLLGNLTGSSGGGKFFLGIIEGMADSLASIMKLWSGGWSDRAVGRKPFVVLGYSLSALSRPLMALVTSPWQLLMVRLSDRLGKGIRNAPRDALLADSAPPEAHGWAFGFHRAMDHVGAVLGPLLAMLLLWAFPGKLEWVFFATIVPGVLVVSLVTALLREAPRVRGDEVADASSGTTSAKRTGFSLTPFGPGFRWYLWSLMLFTLGNSSDAFLLLRAKELGVTEILIPAIWGAFHVVKSVSNLVCGAQLNRFGARPMILAGWAVYGAVYLGFGLASQPWHAWVCFFVYALFYGLTEPAEKTLVALLAGTQQKGLAFGWYNFVIGIGSLPASLLFGAVYQQYGAFTAFGMGAGFALIAAMMLGFVRTAEKADG